MAEAPNNAFSVQCGLLSKERTDVKFYPSKDRFPFTKSVRISIIVKT